MTPGFQIVRRELCAPLDVLRRRPYLTVIRLPFGRYLILGWLWL